MALNFPDAPNPGDEYTSGGKTWRFDGDGWVDVTPIDYADLTGQPSIPDSPDDINAAAVDHNHDSAYTAKTEGIVVYLWNGSDYVKVTSTPRVFVGPNDPSTEGFTMANGDQWEQTS